MPYSQALNDALAIWHAGLEAVRSPTLINAAMQVEGTDLVIDENPIDLRSVRRIAVVGAGKGGAGMADAIEALLGPKLCAEKQVSGWVNVPAGCVRPLRHIHLHPARPAGLNEPTPEGVAGAEAILKIVAGLGPNDLCLCLLSGGGSALLPLPAVGITLADKLAVTRTLSAAGANIEELNSVRKQISRIKGGRLAKACRAGRLVSLIISDVLGDPLDVIASGPTVDDYSTSADALDVLAKYDIHPSHAPTVFKHLQSKQGQQRGKPIGVDSRFTPAACRVTNVVIGNIATAVDAAGVEAERRGFSHAMICARQPEGAAEDVGRHLAAMTLKMQSEEGPDCLISGGEPVVRLPDRSQRGQGGRNQQLVLAALQAMRGNIGDEVAMLSGGTDGEDGPTDAAGAFFDQHIVAAAKRLGLDPASYLARCDAYHFFEPLDALLKTGPTNTNVCDLRVIVARGG